MLSAAETAAIVVGGVALLYFVHRFWSHYARRQRRFKRAINGEDDEDGQDKDANAYTITGNLVKEYTDMPIVNTYTFQDLLLGRGSSAHVVIGIHKKTQRRFAIKIIDTSTKNIAWKYIRELKMLRDTDHTNIVRVYEMYRKPTALYFVMELCTGGHLGQVLKHLPGGHFDQNTARNYIIQVTRAIAHCHHLGIAHRDIKLQNILLESSTKDAQVKLIDFGNAARFSNDTLPLRKIVGTTYTAAPEVFKQEYDERCDIWSMGVVAYILLSGHRPFEAVDLTADQRARESSIIANILLGRYHFLHDSWENVSDVAIHYVKCCLELDYTRRRTAEECLHHPWLAHNDLHENLGVNTPLISASRARKLSKALSRNLISSGIRRTTMLGVAFNMPGNKVQTLRTLFQKMDTQGKGYINLDEFRTAMSVINPEQDPGHATILFDAMDAEGTGLVSFTEFVAASLDPREVDIAELNRAFRLFDKDAKGYIDANDLQRVLETETKRLDDSTSPAISRQNSIDDNKTIQSVQQTSKNHRQKNLQDKILSMIKQSDTDKDGVISYTEFLFIMADRSSDADDTPLAIINSAHGTSVTVERNQRQRLTSTASNITTEQLQSIQNAGNRFKVLTQSSVATATVSGVDSAEKTDADNTHSTDINTEIKTSKPEFEEKKKRRQSDSGVNVFGNKFSFRKNSMLFTQLPSVETFSSWFSAKAQTPMKNIAEAPEKTATKKSFGAQYTQHIGHDPNLRQMVKSDMNKGVLKQFLARSSGKGDIKHQDISEEKNAYNHIPTIPELVWTDLKAVFQRGYKYFHGAVPLESGTVDLKTVRGVDNPEKEIEDSVSDSDSEEEEVQDGQKRKIGRRLSSPAMMWQSIKRRASTTFSTLKQPGTVVPVISSEGHIKTSAPTDVSSELGVLNTAGSEMAPSKAISRVGSSGGSPVESTKTRRGSSQRRSSQLKGLSDMRSDENNIDNFDIGLLPSKLRLELGLPEIAVEDETRVKQTSSASPKEDFPASPHKQYDSAKSSFKGDMSFPIDDAREHSAGRNSSSMDNENSSLSDASAPLKELVAHLKKQQQLNISLGKEAPVDITPDEAQAIANRLVDAIKPAVSAVPNDTSHDSDLSDDYTNSSANKNMKTIYEEGSVKPVGFTEAVYDAFQKGLQFGRSQAVVALAPDVQENELDLEKGLAVSRRHLRRASHS